MPMQRDNKSLGVLKKNEALRARLVHMPRRKWMLVRVFEALLWTIKLLIRPLRPLESPEELPQKILVVEFWNLGDLAILVPFLRNLRRSFPSARVSLLVNRNLSSFLEGQGIVDETIPIRVPWARHFNRWRKYNPFSMDWISLTRTILALRKRRFDWAFSGRMDVRDNFMLWLTGARRRIGCGIGGGGSFLTDQVTPDLSRPHRADVWLHLLEGMGVSVDRKLGHFRLADSELSSAQSHLAALGVPPDAFLIGVHPGARITTRRWGEDRFVEVARRLLNKCDARILWFSEPAKSPECPSWERCHAVSLDFRAFLAVLSRCRLLICNDSGPMHLANLLSVPVVAVFGPQRPDWFGPRGLHDRVVIRPEFSCRPCFDYCVFDQPYCLRAISVDEVYETAQQQISEICQSGSPAIRQVRSSEAVSHVA